MKQRQRVLTAAVGAVALAGILFVPRNVLAGSAVIFNNQSKEGEVWVSVDLARHRLGEDYVPLLVVVRNTAGQPITLNRGSFRLIGADHRAVPLADLTELRDNYRKTYFDLTMIRFFGLPMGTLLDVSTLEPSNFFPVVGDSGVLLDHVTLAKFRWTTDLLYFKRPAGMTEGRKVVLEVAPDGWEVPIRVDIQL